MVALKPVITSIRRKQARDVHLITIRTDQPCNPYLHYQFVRPSYIVRTKVVRGVVMNCGYFWEWHPEGTLRHWEQGDTQLHTFAVPHNLKVGRTWFFLADSPNKATATWTSPMLYTDPTVPIPDATVAGFLPCPSPNLARWDPGTRHAWFADGTWWLVVPAYNALEVWKMHPGPPSLAFSLPALFGPLARIGSTDTRLGPDGKTLYIVAVHKPAFLQAPHLYFYMVDLTSPIVPAGIEIIPVPPPPTSLGSTALEVDASGTAHIVYQRTNVGQFHVYYLTRTATTGTPPVLVPEPAGGLDGPVAIAKSDPLGRSWLLTHRGADRSFLHTIPYSGPPGPPQELPLSLWLTADFGIDASFTAPTIVGMTHAGPAFSVSGDPPTETQGPFAVAPDLGISIISRHLPPAAQTCVYIDLAAMIRPALRYEYAPWVETAAIAPDAASYNGLSFAWPDVAAVYYNSNITGQPILNVVHTA